MTPVPPYEMAAQTARATSVKTSWFFAREKKRQYRGKRTYSVMMAGMNQRKKDDPKPMNLMEYRDSLGLLSDEEKKRLQLMKDLTKAVNRSQVKKNIEKAENILNLDKARQQKAEKGR